MDTVGWFLWLAQTMGVPQGSVVGVIGAAIAVVTVSAASVIGVWSIRANRATARLKATYETISRLIWDEDYIAARRDFARLRNTPGQSEPYLHLFLEQPRDGDHAEELAALRYSVISVLNEYELMALAADQDILDKTFLKEYLKTMVLTDYRACAELIRKFRHNPLPKTVTSRKAYHYFETLACEWGAEAIRPGPPEDTAPGIAQDPTPAAPVVVGTPVPDRTGGA